MIKIVADNKIPFLYGVLDPYAEISYLAGAKTDHTQVKDADALITRTRTKCNASILKGSKVKMIATATIGFDHIDTNYCAQNNIEWTNAPGCNAGSVKQYIASVLATIKLRKGVHLEGKTLGIIGVGNVGSKIKDLGHALGMKVLLNDPPRAEQEGSSNYTELPDLLSQADIITFHVPLNHEGKYKTFHMGDNSFFSQCKKNAIIINSSRGEVIDNYALLENLNNGAVGDAVLDVWENEPDILRPLLQKVIIATPHIAGYSVDGKANGTANSVQAISSFFDFPLKQWYPKNLPLPENPIIQINAENLSFHQIWTKAVLHTYDIMEDDKLIRQAPGTFEELRGNYPVRREFGAYTVKLKNASAEIKQKMNNLGFEHVKLV
jgi:erythronate-4-phosphate dehydrogenase